MKSEHLSRREFLKASGTVAAAALLWRYGGDVALAQIPWEDEKETTLLTGDEKYGVTDQAALGEGRRHHSPRIAIDEKGTIWATWVADEDGVDRVYLTQFDGKRFGEAILLSEPLANGWSPRIFCQSGQVLVAFMESRGRNNHRTVVMSYTPDGGGIEAVAAYPAEGALLDIAFVECGQSWVLATSSLLGKKSSIYLHEPRGEAKLVASASHPNDVRRPSLACDSKERVYIAWDQMTAPGSRTVYMTSYDSNGQQGTTVQVTHHPACNISPALDIDSHDDVWIAWTSNRRGDDEWDIPRWNYLRCYRDGELLDPISLPRDMNLRKEGTDQSFELPQVICASDGKVIVTGRPSHNFCVQWYRGDSWSPLYRLPADGWGGRGQFLDGALDKEGNLWVVRRDLNGNLLHRIPGVVSTERKEPVLRTSTEARDAAPALVNIHTAPNRWEPLTDLEGIDDELNVYYGDIHGHTYMSDGVGEVDEYFHTKRDYYEDDFTSLTDHDTFVGLSISPSGWEYQKEITEQFQKENEFVTLFGQEWTTGRYPRAAGHKCIYSTEIDIPLFDHTKKEFRTTERLYKALKEWPTLIFPHHTGWTGTDWENWDPEIQTLAEIVSNHGCFEYMGNEPIPHRGGARDCFLQDALRRGCRFGFIGGSDNHGLIWHHHAGWKRDCHRTGLACVLAPELTREAIFEAMKKRRTFATTGIKPRLDFRVNNHLMGEEFQTSESSVQINVNLSARHDIKWLTVIKNNEPWYTYGGEGYTSRWSITDKDVAPGTNWYYLRVIFESGDMAWSSPIWVDRVG